MTGIEFRLRRKALELSQEQLAERMGVKQGTVSDWERGTTPIIRIYELALMSIENGLDQSA